MQPVLSTDDLRIERSSTPHAVAATVTPQELCDGYAERVYRFAAIISRGDVEAEDLAQDALERAIRRLGTFDPARGSMESWLWRIVVHAAADAGRTARRRHLLAEKLRTLRPLKEVEDAPMTAMPDADLLAAVRALRPRDRTLIALRFGASLSHAEVGAALGLAPDTAAVACRRALVRLRHNLGKENRT